jgi:uncharacterized protein YeaO (DUF488 family)
MGFLLAAAPHARSAQTIGCAGAGKVPAEFGFPANRPVKPRTAAGPAQGAARGPCVVIGLGAQIVALARRRSKGACWAAMIALKRVYDPPADDDGLRILVDRVWPRGVSRERAKLDHWIKDVAPSTALRTWFGHRPERWKEFAKRYRAELKDNPALEELRRLIGRRRATLVYSARDRDRNQAVALRDALLRRSSAQAMAGKRGRAGQAPAKRRSKAARARS